MAEYLSLFGWLHRGLYIVFSLKNRPWMLLVVSVKYLDEPEFSDCLWACKQKTSRDLSIKRVVLNSDEKFIVCSIEVLDKISYLRLQKILCILAKALILLRRASSLSAFFFAFSASSLVSIFVKFSFSAGVRGVIGLPFPKKWRSILVTCSAK